MRKHLFCFLLFCFQSCLLAFGAASLWADVEGPTSGSGGNQTMQSIGLEGTTADAYETWLKAEDPTTDNNATFPDYDGYLPIVISQGTTQTSHGDANATDVTNSSLSLPADWFTAGKSLKWTLVGTITGGNGAKKVHLYIDDGQIVTLTTQAATTGDWKAEFVMSAVNATAQDCWGELIVAAGADVEFDYATDTTAMNATKTVKCQAELTNASDAITVEQVVIEHWISQ